MVNNKVVVIGLDGASFELIQPWIDEGSLPTLEKIQKEGCYGDLKVCLPPVTCPNWKCYSTGLNPGKIGAFWWENINTESRRVYHPQENYSKHKEIWDYLGEKGNKVFVANTPTTYPPKEVNGYMISGSVTSGDRYTYPKELQSELEEEGFSPSAERTNLNFYTKEEIGEDCLRNMRKKLEVYKKWISKDNIDFYQLALFHTNTLNHNLWDHPLTKEAWKKIDKFCKWILDRTEANLIFMSDHGSNKIEKQFNINAWLRKRGYLVLKEQKTKFLDFLHSLGITQESLYSLVKGLIKRDTIVRILPDWVRNNIPMNARNVWREFKEDKIEWDKSRAVASG